MTPTDDTRARAAAEEWIAKHDGRVISKFAGDSKLMVTSLVLLADAVAQAVKARVPPCGTCGGVPPSSGLPCICSGRNTIYAEVQGLRGVAHEQAEEIARLLNDRVAQTEASWRSLDAGIAERVQAAVAAECQWWMEREDDDFPKVKKTNSRCPAICHCAACRVEGYCICMRRE